MENQHRQIKGYRELSQEEIDLMNEIKQKGIELGDLVLQLENYNRPIDGAPSYDNVLKRDALRWVAIGRTQLQQGLMALTRSVAKPEFF